MSHTSIKKCIQPRQHSDIEVKHICCFCVLLNTKIDASKMAAISWYFYRGVVYFCGKLYIYYHFISIRKRLNFPIKSKDIFHFLMRNYNFQISISQTCCTVHNTSINKLKIIINQYNNPIKVHKFTKQSNSQNNQINLPQIPDDLTETNIILRT